MADQAFPGETKKRTCINRIDHRSLGHRGIELCISAAARSGWVMCTLCWLVVVNAKTINLSDDPFVNFGRSRSRSIVR